MLAQQQHASWARGRVPRHNSRHVVARQAGKAGPGTYLALKDWALTLRVLHDGEQTLLMRKGGIKDKTFQLPQRSFLLFPTSFHADGQLLKPGVAERHAQDLALEPRNERTLQLATYVEVTGAWAVPVDEDLAGLGGLHVFTQDFVASRQKWRPQQALTLLEVRAVRLQDPVVVTVGEDLFGCFSFFDVEGAPGSKLDLARAKPALDDQTFARKQQQLRDGLQQIRHTPLPLPV